MVVIAFVPRGNFPLQLPCFLNVVVLLHLQHHDSRDVILFWERHQTPPESNVGRRSTSSHSYSNVLRCGDPEDYVLWKRSSPYCHMCPNRTLCIFLRFHSAHSDHLRWWDNNGNSYRETHQTGTIVLERICMHVIDPSICPSSFHLVYLHTFYSPCILNLSICHFIIHLKFSSLHASLEGQNISMTLMMSAALCSTIHKIQILQTLNI